MLRFTAHAMLVLILSVLWVAAPAQADNGEELDRAILMFERGDYLAAQEALVAVDRDSLNDREKALRDDYLNRVQVAIMMFEKALRDLEDADLAIGEGEHERAAELLNAVLDNEYAAAAVRQAAEDRLDYLRFENADQPEARQEAPPPAREAAPPAEIPPLNGPMERARVLTAEARDMVRAGRYDVARRLYQEALEAVAGYPEAVEGLRMLDEHERNIAGTRAESLIDRIRRDDQINWQRTVSEFRDVERTVREHVAAERFDEARALLIRARQVVESGRQFADPLSKYESLMSEYVILADRVAEDERIYNERRVAEIRRQIEEERAARIRADAENRARQVASLMAQARQHRKDGDLDAAINVLHQVTIIDPNERDARWLLDELEDNRQMRRGRDVRHQFYSESQKVLIEVEEAKIPWHQELQYPANWPELISRPDRVGSVRTPQNRRLISALERSIPLDIRGEPFGEVIERFAHAHQINIIVNWADLKKANVDRGTIIDLSVPGEITLQRAITEILEQAAAGGNELGYDLDEGTLKIATRETLDKRTYTAVYDINDLLMEIPHFTDSPMTDLTQANRRSIPRQAETPERPWRQSIEDDIEFERDPARMSRVQQIINLITESVASHSWVERGGTVGTIKEINGQLVVTQNSSGQREIGNLLGKLREQRAIQISVEARFITVASHYLEELGIDIDVVLNAGNAGFDYVPGAGGAVLDPVLGQPLLLPRTFSRLGFTPNVPGLGTATTTDPAGGINQPFNQPFLVPGGRGGSGSRLTPVPVRSNLTGFTDPSNLGSDVPGSFAGQTIGPAFSIFGSFLDNIQVDFLIRATQADSRTSVLTAPRLVLFNGQRSWVAVTIQQNFVSQLNPVVAQGAVAQAPQVGTIDSGAVLDVTATVTADKRYVTMTLRPGVTRLLDLQTIPFSGGGAGGGFGGGTALNAFIQLPTLSSQRVQTTVSVPDGGTLLIGGQKLASETEVEAGVPILSKIPILKRAYSSRSMIKDEQTLLILIKPKIYIQPEQEELAFPSFGQR